MKEDIYPISLNKVQLAEWLSRSKKLSATLISDNWIIIRRFEKVEK